MGIIGGTVIRLVTFRILKICTEEIVLNNKMCMKWLKAQNTL